MEAETTFGLRIMLVEINVFSSIGLFHMSLNHIFILRIYMSDFI